MTLRKAAVRELWDYAAHLEPQRRWRFRRHLDDQEFASVAYVILQLGPGPQWYPGELYQQRPATELVTSALLDLLATWPKKPRAGAIQRLRRTPK